MKKGDVVGLLHVIKITKLDYDFTELGKMHNHSNSPNCHNVLIGNKRHLVASRDINQGEELTTDYTLQPDLEQPQEDWMINESPVREMKPHIDGYRTYSPFKDLDYIIVDGNGIDCDNIVWDLILVGDDGSVKFGPKNSGSHFLENATKVVELPLKNGENISELIHDKDLLKKWIFDYIDRVDNKFELRRNFFNKGLK